MVDKMFMKYDFNRSGYLEKRECLRLLDDVLMQKGQPQATMAQFNHWFTEYDINGDGIISRGELTGFVRKFLKSQEIFPHD
jgi:Ca2+-binding EF-hand superfamily protein